MTDHLLLLLIVFTTASVGSLQAQLTRIIRTGDPIPDSPGLTAGANIRTAKIDTGQVVFFTEHTEFGLDKPSNTLLFWDGSALTKIADDFTPVPGLPGATLDFNTPPELENLSIDGVASPALIPVVVFYASYQPGDGIEDGQTIYRWTPSIGIQPIFRPGSGADLSYILPGRYSDGVLLFSTWFTVGPEADRGLYSYNNGALSKLLSPGDDIPGEPGNTFDHAFDDYFFNNRRTVARLNATPPSRSGWWDLRGAGPAAALPLILIGDEFMTNDYHFTNVQIRGIDQSSDPNGGAVAHAAGTAGGNPSVGLFFSTTQGAPFQPVVRRGAPTYGALGFQFWNFNAVNILHDIVVFSANSYDPTFTNEMHGIYNFGDPTSPSNLIDTNSTIDGKQPASMQLLDRDPTSGTILFSVSFTDNTLALYTMPMGIPKFGYQEWISDQFPDAGGDENIIGTLADPDDDRVANIVEFTLGGEANRPDPKQSTPTPDPDGTEFAYRRRAEIPETVTITAQIATSPQGPWQTGPGVLEEISSTPDPENPALSIVRVRSLLPATARANFFRILVSSSE
jgi:hypothetical protein